VGVGFTELEPAYDEGLVGRDCWKPEEKEGERIGCEKPEE
jgi:hypothetical protein